MEIQERQEPERFVDRRCRFIEEQPIRSHAVGNVTVRDFAESVKLSL